MSLRKIQVQAWSIDSPSDIRVDDYLGSGKSRGFNYH